MENKEILEGNKLIAEFMGGEIFTDFDGGYKRVRNIEPNKKTSRYLWNLEYHISWDWIMPVVDKIEKKGCIIEISYSIVCMCRICIIGKKYEKAFNIINDNNGGIQPISAVYKSIVEFIKWYNQNNNG